MDRKAFLTNEDSGEEYKEQPELRRVRVGAGEELERRAMYGWLRIDDVITGDSDRENDERELVGEET